MVGSWLTRREKLSDDGSVHDKDNQYTWADAFDVKIRALNEQRFAGREDWRVPNVRELESLLDYAKVAPAVSSAFNSACAPGCTAATCSCTVSAFHWSSTTYQYDQSFAWGIIFVNGNMNSGPKVNAYPVRAVRGGGFEVFTARAMTSRETRHSAAIAERRP